MNTSLLSQELGPLKARIGQHRQAVAKLTGMLKAVEAELAAFATDQQRFDALQEACNALDKLQKIGAGELFWDGLPVGTDAAKHAERLRARIGAFGEETQGLYKKREMIRKKIGLHQNALEGLFEEVRQARIREEYRQAEFVIVREISHIPYQPTLMPWSKEVESEKRFRRALLVSLFWSLLLGIAIPLVNVPLPDRINLVLEVPERVAMLLKQEQVRPAPPKPQEQVRPEPDQEKPAETEKTAEAKKAPDKQPPVATAEDEVKVARKKTENIGVLAFKSSFSDLMDEVPVASLNADARLIKDPRVPGEARAQRSLVAMQAKAGSSGGINNYRVSRNLGAGGQGGGSGYGTAGQIDGVGTAKIASAVAGLTERAGRPLSDGLGSGRTDEEIQIVFDRYKATLYRIYNKELRKDPTLRGKLLLRLTIEPGGEVSMCAVESTDLASSELVAKIVERVKSINFGPKEDVTTITILYPIDFLPAG